VAELGFWEVAQRDPGRLALVDHDAAEMTAGELLAQSNRVVHGLRALGVSPGDAVAAVLPNSAALVELYLAAMQSGIYLVPINFHLAASEIAYIVSDSEARAVVCSEDFGDICRAALDETDVSPDARFAVGDVAGFRPYDTLKAEQPTGLPDDRRTGGVMNYTAGTTGRPKGVRREIPPIDPDTSAELFTYFFLLFDIQPHDDNVHLVTSPMYHTAVLTFAMTSLHAGHGIVLTKKWDSEKTLELIERYKVTTTHMVPTQFRRLLELPPDTRERYDVSSLRHVVHSAAPCPVEVKQRMLDWWGPVIDEYYAATEGGGTLASPEEWLKKPGTVGKAWPMSEIRILDDEGAPCPTGEAGTVWIKMGDYTFEYNKDKAKTEESWRQGFFTVGDVGYLDEDGYLFLCDRKSDMIISGGVNIYPAEVEAVLLTHRKIGDAAVIGVPDESWGEQVKAVVQAAAGVQVSPLLEKELIDFCRERIAHYKCPRSIDFVDELPRDPNGKLYKRKVRDRYWQGRARAI
jgi:long-chain acyl-CoA synthetase